MAASVSRRLSWLLSGPGRRHFRPAGAVPRAEVGAGGSARSRGVILTAPTPRLFILGVVEVLNDGDAGGGGMALVVVMVVMVTAMGGGGVAHSAVTGRSGRLLVTFSAVVLKECISR